MISKIVIVCTAVAFGTAARYPISQSSHQQLSYSNRNLRLEHPNYRDYGYASGSQRFDVQRQNARDQQRHDDESENSDYEFSYAVRDDYTGDIKSQKEVRRGDLVRGQYRMRESDGTERIVNYGSDDVHGFNSVIRHEPSNSGVQRLRSSSRFNQQGNTHTVQQFARQQNFGENRY